MELNLLAAGHRIARNSLVAQGDSRTESPQGKGVVECAGKFWSLMMTRT
jgi:hypothetical protein